MGHKVDAEVGPIHGLEMPLLTGIVEVMQRRWRRRLHLGLVGLVHLRRISQSVWVRRWRRRRRPSKVRGILSPRSKS